ncbi:MAG TPA: hypothetical protein VGQ57_18105 [Polyangiaceae bacterium]|jgi:hypothetical protein|nr:hypothetical protein [Polyangiaceae bacterium]
MNLSSTPRSSLFILLCLLAPLLACGMLKKKNATTEPSAVASAPPPPPPPPAVTATAAPEVKVSDEQIPTSEDFEDEAFEKVTAKSYKTELDTLKKQIETPPSP